MNDDFDDTERALARHFEGLEAPAGVRRWGQGPRASRSRWTDAPRRPVALAAAALLALGAGLTGGALGLRGSHAGSAGDAGSAAMPSARAGAAMAFDGTGVMLFGGSDGRESLGDTWRWDGTRWSQLHPHHAPSARDHAFAVYDQRTGRVLLIGGSSLTPAPEPAPKRGDGQAVLGRPCYVGAADATVRTMPPPGLLPPNGGNCQSFIGHPGEVWSWDGSDWTQRAGLPGSGGAATGMVVAATTDASGGVVVDELANSPRPERGTVICAVGAGAANSGASAPDAPPAVGSPPLTAQPAPPPLPVIQPAPVSGCASSFGGITHRVLTGDGDSWKVTETSAPFLGPRWSSVAYDAASHRVVSFAPAPMEGCGTAGAGVTGTAAGTATSTGQPAGTAPGAPGRPPVRCLASTNAATSACCPQAEFALSGGAWKQVATVQVPLLAAVLSDPGRGLVGLGAAASAGASGGTYVWDGHRWTMRPHANTPPERFDFASASDGHGRVLLFGGAGPGGGGMREYGDLWSWDGSSWSRLAGASAPPLPTPPLEPPSGAPCPVSGPLRGSPGPSGGSSGPSAGASGSTGSAGGGAATATSSPGSSSSGASGMPAAPPPCGPGLMQPLLAPSPAAVAHP